MTREEAERIIKSEMCKKCGVYLGGGKCDKDCRVIQCIEALSNQPKTGYWKWVKRDKDIDICCSECGYAAAPEYAYDYELCELDKQELVKFTMSHQFCTGCGTKMESER